MLICSITHNRNRNTVKFVNIKKSCFKSAVRIIMACIAAIFAGACSVSRYVPDNEYFLKDIKISSDNKKILKNYSLRDYIVQTPNTKWFGAKVPLKIYCLSGTDTTKWNCRFLRKLGESPVIYDSAATEKSKRNIVNMLSSEGYMHASVQQIKRIKGKKMVLEYRVKPGDRYSVRSLKKDIYDSEIAQILATTETENSLIRPGMVFNVNRLDQERNRITKILKDRGYYNFNKEYITFTADTCSGSTKVDLTMHIKLYKADEDSRPQMHKRYVIGDINYYSDVENFLNPLDTITYENNRIIYQNKLHFRPSLLTSNTMMSSGDVYNERNMQKTMSNFSRLQAIRFSNIRFRERENSDTLDCSIVLNHSKPKSIKFEIEGTNSAGDLGAAASATFQHKNLFKGSETLMFKLRGAYEAITGLEGYDGNSYVEFGVEGRLTFPNFLFPFISKSFGRSLNASSEISLQYNWQNRPEFNRRVLTAAWRYRWNSRDQKMQNKFDLLEVNYVYMPWISKTFKEEYLDSIGKTNAILKYNYENLLITKLGYSFTYNSLGTSNTTTYGKNAITIRANIETSGNVLYGLTNMVNGKKNADGQYTFCGIAYAQYVKGDFDFTKSTRIDRNNSVAFHIGFGIAYPYGNSNILPFEKRYFSGGANSVRGWSVRSLGPGSYSGGDKNINFINQSGDIKLDINLEYRAYLFWKLNGAFFIDAGNIWTIREYEDQPGGAFHFKDFYKQIALSYGIGLRLNLDFFILRLDAGMKAIDPAYKGRAHYPITNPDFSKDLSLHFAVGLPF